MNYDNILSVPGVTYARAGVATAATSTGVIVNFAANEPRRTDAGLRVENASTNLALRSQELDNASWVPENVTVAINSTAAPDGTSTADKIQETVASAGHLLAPTYASKLASNRYTISGFAKAAERDRLRIGFGTSFCSAGAAMNILLSGAGSITSITGGGAPTGTISQIANGWYYFTLSVTAAADVAGFNTSFIILNSSSLSVYTGEAGAGLFMWGIQLEASDFATSYIPTTSVAVTRAADSFSLVKTLTSATDFTISSESTLSEKTASILLEGNTTNGVSIVRSVNGAIFPMIYKDGLLISTFEGILKPGAVRIKWALTRQAGVFAFYVDGTALTSINTSQLLQFPTTTFTGSTLRSYNFSPFSIASSQAISLTANLAPTPTIVPHYEALVRPDLNDIIDNTNTLAFMNSGAELMFVSGYYRAGLQTSTSILSLPGATYTRAGAATAENAAGAIINFAAGVPRITDRGVLIEEARTNLFLRSQEGSNAVWANINTTVTAAVAPDGTNTASLLTATTTAVTMVNQSVTGAGSASGNTFSVFVKKGSAAAEGNNFILRNDTTATNLLGFLFNYDTGVITYTIGSSGVSAVALSGGWWRIILTATSGISAGNSLRGYIGFTGSSVPAGQSMHWWGAQLEAGAFATSYIPTTTAAATRAVDRLHVSAPSGLTYPISMSAEFFLPVDSATTRTVAQAVVNGSDSNRANLRLAINRSMCALMTTGGSEVAAVNAAGTIAAVGVITDMAGRFALDNVNGAMGSVIGAADTSAALPSVPPTVIRVGGSDATGAELNGYVRYVVCFPFAISDNQLQAQSNLPAAPQVDEALRPAELSTILARGALYGITGDTAFRDSGVEALFQTPYYRKGLLFGTSTNAISLATTRTSAGVALTVAGGFTSFAANIPRITDRGILVEEARTNFVRESQTLTAATWVTTGTVTRTADHAVAPDGTTTADRIEFGTGTSYIGHSTNGNPASTVSTLSFWAKAVTSGHVIASRSGASGTSALHTLTTSWQRFTRTFTSHASIEIVQFSNSGLIAGASEICDFHIWGVQFEAGGEASSYIATAGTSATRAVDTVDAVLGTTPQAVFVQARVNAFTAGARPFDIHNGTNSERVSITVNIAGSISAFVTVGGVQTTIGVANSVATAGTTFKALVRRSASGTWRLFVNGVAIGTESAVIALPSATLLSVGRLRAGSEYLMGTVERLVTFPTIPTDAQCITLTT